MQENIAVVNVTLVLASTCIYLLYFVHKLIFAGIQLVYVFSFTHIHIMNEGEPPLFGTPDAGPF